MVENLGGRLLGRPHDELERLSVNGPGILLGHPAGATGGRIMATLLREMARREAAYGLETMCIGGGQGLAAVCARVTGQQPPAATGAKPDVTLRPVSPRAPVRRPPPLLTARSSP